MLIQLKNGYTDNNNIAKYALFFNLHFISETFY